MKRLQTNQPSLSALQRTVSQFLALQFLKDVTLKVYMPSFHEPKVAAKHKETVWHFKQRIIHAHGIRAHWLLRTVYDSWRVFPSIARLYSHPCLTSSGILWCLWFWFHWSSEVPRRTGYEFACWMHSMTSERVIQQTCSEKNDSFQVSLGFSLWRRAQSVYEAWVMRAHKSVNKNCLFPNIM